MPTAALEEPVQQFTIGFEETGAGAADMVLRWETTEVRVPIEAVER